MIEWQSYRLLVDPPHYDPSWWILVVPRVVVGRPPRPWECFRTTPVRPVRVPIVVAVLVPLVFEVGLSVLPDVDVLGPVRPAAWLVPPVVDAVVRVEFRPRVGSVPVPVESVPLVPSALVVDIDLVIVAKG